MERYLGGEESAARTSPLRSRPPSRATSSTVACGVATKNLGSHSLLDLLVEGVRRAAKKPSPSRREGTTSAFVFKTVADPFAGRISFFRVFSGTARRLEPRQPRATTRRSASER